MPCIKAKCIVDDRNVDMFIKSIGRPWQLYCIWQTSFELANKQTPFSWTDSTKVPTQCVSSSYIFKFFWNKILKYYLHTEINNPVHYNTTNIKSVCKLLFNRYNLLSWIKSFTLLIPMKAIVLCDRLNDHLLMTVFFRIFKLKFVFSVEKKNLWSLAAFSLFICLMRSCFFFQNT